MKIIIATRGSKLALWQAQWVAQELMGLHPGLAVELLKIKTTGDKIQDVPLAKVGGKGLFVKEIEDCLLRREAHIAVHSMKDVPADLPQGLHLPVVCKREDPRDALVVREGESLKSLAQLPPAARVGTSSLRRQCQILARRPDITLDMLRGNLDTRVRKLDEGLFDAIVLACAGLKRLGLGHRISEYLPVDTLLPAVGQGAVGIECRVDDEEVNAMIALLNHLPTYQCVTGERAFLQRLEGGCQVPIACHAVLDEKGMIHMEGLVSTLSGDRMIRSTIDGDPAGAQALGIQLANQLLAAGAQEILRAIYEKG